jgi:hypothetical protein
LQALPGGRPNRRTGRLANWEADLEAAAVFDGLVLEQRGLRADIFGPRDNPILEGELKRGSRRLSIARSFTGNHRKLWEKRMLR